MDEYIAVYLYDVKRAINNFIESVLAERVKAQYRKETLQAVEDIKDGKTFGPVDTTSVESMLKSMGL